MAKMSLLWNPFIKGFQMMEKSNTFKKVSILVNLPNLRLLWLAMRKLAIIITYA